MNDKKWMHYDYSSKFREYFMRNLLTEDHLQPYKIEIRKMTLPDGDINDEYNFRGWELRKNNVRYLISDSMKGQSVDIKSILPILPKRPIELGAKGLVYSHVKAPVSMKFKEEQTMSFRELVDLLTGLNHSNKTHQYLAHFKALASTFFRYNDRTATNPGFGKDSIVELHNSLVGKCGTIESPTLAKIEERSVSLNWLVINEVIDIGTAEWRTIQQYLLASGAHKPTIAKHSRAFGNVGEEIDLSKLSLGLFYNDITDYEDPSKYFDVISKEAVKDRFPAFRLHGHFTEDFNSLGHGDVELYIKKHADEFKTIVHNYIYYKNHILELVHNYDKNVLRKQQSRNATNIDRLLAIIDAYCESQEEFNDWLEVINDSMLDYEHMVVYPKLLPELYNKLKISKNISDNFTCIKDCAGYLSTKKENEHKYEYVIDIISADTFTEKNKLIREYKEKQGEYKNDVWN